jgi:hypothetical protein
MSVYVLSISVKRYCGNEYTRNNSRIVGRVVFSTVHVRVKGKYVIFSFQKFYLK